MYDPIIETRVLTLDKLDATLGDTLVDTLGNTFHDTLDDTLTLSA